VVLLRTLTIAVIAFVLLSVGFNTSVGNKPNSQPEQTIADAKLGYEEDSTFNWSGYAVQSEVGTFDNIRGSWTQPEVKCAQTGTQVAAYWIGIDGFDSESVEQLGTGTACKNGKAVHYAWFEFYPAPAKIIQTVSVAPDDQLSAEISAKGQRFTMTIRNLTSGESFTTSRVMPNAPKASVEWITEAPSALNGAGLPLSNFGSVSFTGSSASREGVSRDVRLSAWPSRQLTMVTPSGEVRANATSLSEDGQNFKVIWARH